MNKAVAEITERENAEKVAEMKLTLETSKFLKEFGQIVIDSLKSQIERDQKALANARELLGTIENSEAEFIETGDVDTFTKNVNQKARNVMIEMGYDPDKPVNFSGLLI